MSKLTEIPTVSLVSASNCQLDTYTLLIASYLIQCSMPIPWHPIFSCRMPPHCQPTTCKLNNGLHSQLLTWPCHSWMLHHLNAQTKTTGREDEVNSGRFSFVLRTTSHNDWLRQRQAHYNEVCLHQGSQVGKRLPLGRCLIAWPMLVFTSSHFKHCNWHCLTVIDLPSRQSHLRCACLGVTSITTATANAHTAISAGASWEYAEVCTYQRYKSKCGYPLQISVTSNEVLWNQHMLFSTIFTFII